MKPLPVRMRRFAIGVPIFLVMLAIAWAMFAVAGLSNAPAFMALIALALFLVVYKVTKEV